MKRSDERMKALIAMSGGVDSSVAAYLVREQGFECMGVTMKLFSGDGEKKTERTCCSLDDVEDARSVAWSLGMKYRVFNFTDRFSHDVIDRFVSAYQSGRTPNPCIDCNRYMKFDKLFMRMKELGFDRIATGHYARIEYDGQSGRYLLKKAVDPSKDQSYVLYVMTQEQLSSTLFPLGGLKKSEVRATAEKLGFANAKKHDSQDICFVPDRDYAGFIERYTGKPSVPGDFVDRNGNVLGRHRGIIRYTVGQRKGLSLSLPEPMYVTGIDAKENNVILGKDSELYSTVLTADRINLISVPKIEGEMRVTAKVRYHGEEIPAVVTQPGKDLIRVEFDRPQRAVTPGQAVVLYDKDTVVGGGTIK